MQLPSYVTVVLLLLINCGYSVVVVVAAVTVALKVRIGIAGGLVGPGTSLVSLAETSVNMSALQQ